MARTGCRLEGAGEMDGNLADLEGLFDAATLTAAGIDALQPIAEAARGMVRRRSGRLARSIAAGDKLSPAQAAASRPEPGTVEAYVGPGSMTQAITEEFGTVHEQGHPYLRPAWDQGARAVLPRVARILSAKLKR